MARALADFGVDDPTLEEPALLDGFPEDLWANRYNRPYQSALPSWMFSP